MTLVVGFATFAAVIWVGLSSTSAPSTGAVGGTHDQEAASPDSLRLKELAEGLERQTLYSQAADVWSEYINTAGIVGELLGGIRYRQGKCLKQAGRYGDAARCFLEVESLPVAADRKRSAGQLHLECLSALGKHAVREAEVRKRATGDTNEGEIVLAEVGGERITAADLRAELERQAEEAATIQGMSNEEASQIVSQFLSNRQQVEQMVQVMISHRVLYQEALERGLGESDETAAAVDRLRRDFLAQAVMEDRVEGIQLSDTDIENHYKANQDRFTEPAAVKLSYLVFASKETAESAIASNLLDKGQSNEIGQWITRESGVPGLGASGPMMAQLFALAPGSWGDKVWPVGPPDTTDQWVVFRVDEKRNQSVPALNEIRQQVVNDLSAMKQDEAIDALQEELRQKFSVEIDSGGLDKMLRSAGSEGS
jgi:hypothetical protein